MDCPDRQRLQEIFQVTHQEAEWVMKEEYRLYSENSPRAIEFGEVVKRAMELRSQALADYRTHVLDHGCLDSGVKGTAPKSAG